MTGARCVYDDEVEECGWWLLQLQKVLIDLDPLTIHTASASMRCILSDPDDGEDNRL